MSTVLRAQGLGKRYKRRWALRNCDLEVPAGRVVGLVGPNGAGKSPLLNLASGMLTPTVGTIEVCGGRPAAGAEQLAKVGFVAQDTPTYAALSVADHLGLGRRLNPDWDDAVARDRIRRLGLDPTGLHDPARRCGTRHPARTGGTPMIWLTWRQFRVQAAVVFAAVAAFAAALVVSGPHLADLHRTAGSSLVDQVSGADQTLYYTGLLAVLAVPAVIGMFWGAPLIARELETGTHHLAWNQGVTRTRWLATKLGLGATASMTAAGLTSLAVSWWSSPIDRAVDGGGATDTYFPRLDPVAFAARGVVPMAHAAFAFVLGVALGLVIRRTLPAMATTFALYTAVQIAVPMWIRGHLAAADRTTAPIEPDGAPISIQDGAGQIIAHLEEVPGSWVTSQQTLNAAGHPAPVPSSFADCLRTESGPPPPQQVEGCVADLGALGYKQQVTYQPAGNFWALQRAETGLYLGLALALTGFCAWWIRRRVT